MSLRPGWLWPHTQGPAPSGGWPSGQREPGPDEGGWLGWGHVLRQQAQGQTTKARHPASLAEGPSAHGPVLTAALGHIPRPSFPRWLHEDGAGAGLYRAWNLAYACACVHVCTRVCVHVYVCAGTFVCNACEG